MGVLLPPIDRPGPRLPLSVSQDRVSRSSACSQMRVHARTQPPSFPFTHICTHRFSTIDQDPGRFICNYLYYESLRQCEQSAANCQPDASPSPSSAPSRALEAEFVPEHALFVHVPPTEVIFQMKWLAAVRLMGCLCLNLCVYVSRCHFALLFLFCCLRSCSTSPPLGRVSVPVSLCLNL